MNISNICSLYLMSIVYAVCMPHMLFFYNEITLLFLYKKLGIIVPAQKISTVLRSLGGIHLMFKSG
jgi:hypothetical protein